MTSSRSRSASVLPLQQPTREGRPSPVQLGVAHQRAEDVQRSRWGRAARAAPTGQRCTRRRSAGSCGVAVRQGPKSGNDRPAVRRRLRRRRATATSISTAPPRGSAATPMAERVWRPRRPKHVGQQPAGPVDHRRLRVEARVDRRRSRSPASTRSMRSSDPSSARSTDSALSAHHRAASAPCSTDRSTPRRAGVDQLALVVARQLPGRAGHPAVHDDRVERVVRRVRTRKNEVEVDQPGLGRVVDGRGGIHARRRYPVGFPPARRGAHRYVAPMPTPTAKADSFLALHVPGRPLLLPNPWDIGSARLLAHLGFEALATTSGGFAATLGRLDGSVTRDEAIDHAAQHRRPRSTCPSRPISRTGSPTTRRTSPRPSRWRSGRAWPVARSRTTRVTWPIRSTARSGR